MKQSILATLLAFALVAEPAQATVIEYELTDLGGGSYEYVYNVINDTLAVDIEEFSIYFSDTATNLTVGGSTPAGWDPLTIQQDPNLPDIGFYDAFALGVGIAPGDSLGGFSVTFDWNDANTQPGSQFFEIVLITQFDLVVLDEGLTVPAGDAAPVPEPGSLGLLALGLLALGKRHKQRTASMS